MLEITRRTQERQWNQNSARLNLWKDVGACHLPPMATCQKKTRVMRVAFHELDGGGKVLKTWLWSIDDDYDAVYRFIYHRRSSIYNLFISTNPTSGEWQRVNTRSKVELNIHRQVTCHNKRHRHQYYQVFCSSHIIFHESLSSSSSTLSSSSSPFHLLLWCINSRTYHL